MSYSLQRSVPRSESTAFDDDTRNPIFFLHLPSSILLHYMTIISAHSKSAMTAIGSLGYEVFMGLWYIFICLFMIAITFALIAKTIYNVSALLINMSQNHGIDIFEILETILCQAGCISHWPLMLTNTIAKQSTLEEDRKNQLDFLAVKENTIASLRELQQREIYLMEHGDHPTEASALYQATADKRHSPNTQERLKEVSLEGRELWLRFKALPSRQPSGAWIREDLRKSKRAQHHRDEHLCRQYRGCCAFDCGCCMKPRATRQGQVSSTMPLSASHCTVWCLCCRRREMPALDMTVDLKRETVEGL